MRSKSSTTSSIMEHAARGALHEMLDDIAHHFNAIEPKIHAFVDNTVSFERLHHEADALLKQYPDSGNRPPLFGIPIAVKDIFNVDGFETRAGTKLPPETFAGPEAPCITALKNAGALILGKTITTEFAYLAPGPTRNPNDLEHTPGGSSSGSAAAVAAGLAPVALGSQTVGSLIRPASYCGIYAFKPSYDRINKAGVVPLAPRADHIGFLADSLNSLSRTAAVLCAHWSDKSEPKRPVLGIPGTDYLNCAEDRGRAHFGMVKELLAVAGYTIIETDVLTDFLALHERHMDLCAIESAEVHQAWRNQWEKEYDPRTLKLLDRANDVSETRRAEVIASQEQLREALESEMTQRGIDLWIAPAATGPAPLGIGSTGSGIMNGPWTHAGLPSVGIPAGRDVDGLPLGLQIVGRFMDDEHTIEGARFIEETLHFA